MATGIVQNTVNAVKNAHPAVKIGLAILLPSLLGASIWYVVVRKTKNGTTLWENWTGSSNTPDSSTPSVTNNASSAKTNSAPTANNSSVGFPLQIGSTGILVKNLQTWLNQMNLGTPLVVDGIFGALTQQALKSSGYGYPLSQADYNTIQKS